MKKNILFVGLYDDHNFGDPIIGECTEWIYRRQLTKADTTTSKSVWTEALTGTAHDR